MSDKRKSAARVKMAFFRVTEAEDAFLKRKAEEHGYPNTSEFMRANLIREGRFKAKKTVV